MMNNGVHFKAEEMFSFNQTSVLLRSLSLPPPHFFCLSPTPTHVHICMFTLLESCSLNATLTPFCHSSPSRVNTVTFQRTD